MSLMSNHMNPNVYSIIGEQNRVQEIYLQTRLLTRKER